MADSCRVFDRMVGHSVVSWTALLLGYTENGEAELALDLIPLMTARAGLSCLPDARTLAAIIKACTKLVDLQTGRSFHAEVLRQGFESEAVTTNCLVDLYAKCGAMERAHQTFDTIEAVTSPITWTSLIASYTRHCESESVFQLFAAMRDQGLVAYEATMVCVLTACSHTGMIARGIKAFESIERPSTDQYHCVMSRANRLEAAVEVAETMPCEASAVTWRMVLGGCHKWNNVEVARVAFQRLIQVDARDLAGYTLMGNVFGAAGLWEEKLRVDAILLKSSLQLPALL